MERKPDWLPGFLVQIYCNRMIQTMNKSFIGKKLLSLLLSVLMCLSLIPSVAFATIAEGETVSTKEALISALKNGGNVKLESDIELTDTLTVTNEVTLDLNGKAITSSAATPAVLVSAGANLTVKDSVGGGKVTTAKFNASCVENYGVLNIEGGEFSAYYGAVKACGGSDTTINGGTFSDTGKRVGGGYSLYFYADGKNLTVTINGGVFKSNVDVSGIKNNKDYLTLKINGGSFSNDLSDYCEDGYGTVLDEKIRIVCLQQAFCFCRLCRR